jgi:predicted HAD superfamily Cof-like phosphohydrolase
VFLLQMQEQLKAVELFHNTFGVKNGEEPQLINPKEALLRFNLMEEENKEYFDACIEGDLVEIADALGDKLYILCGTILRHGMQNIIEEVFEEIQRSNMSKLGEDGEPIYREDGKLLKGPSYFKPNLIHIVNERTNKRSTDSGNTSSISTSTS